MKTQYRCEKCWQERDIPPQNVPKAEIQLFGKWLCRGCYADWVRQMNVIWNLSADHSVEGDY